MWPATLQSAALRADLLITVLAAAGAFAYLAHLARRPQRSLLEARTRLLVGTAGLLCAVRAFAWTWPDDLGVQIVAFMPATLLPLAMTLFVEGLLRRHVPRWVKLFGAAIGLAAFLVNLMRPALGPALTNAALGASFAAGLLVHMAVLGLVLLRRDRRSLSRAENGLVDAVLWTTALAVPLAATDFRPALGWPPNRMGGLAVLIFLFTLLRPARARTRRMVWAYDVARLTGTAVIAVVVFAFLAGPPTGDAIVHWTSVAVAVVLLAVVLQRTREVDRGDRQRHLLEWLAEPLPGSFERFTHSLRRLPLTADARLIDEAALAGYDIDRIVDELRTGPAVRAHGALAAASDLTADRAREELVDLLERHDMTHVAMIREHPLLLLLVASPELPGAGEAGQEIAAVVRRAQHAIAIEESSRSGASQERVHAR